MALEIERKFLVHRQKWEALEKPTGAYLRQGYLLNEPDKTIRVRQTETTGFLTIKGLSVGATRPEFEYEIPRAEAGELLDGFSTGQLTKWRYRILRGHHVWEVDEFLGDNSGLIVAEIELSSEDEVVELPDWIDREVTEEAQYYNANLSMHPFSLWGSIRDKH